MGDDTSIRRLLNGTDDQIAQAVAEMTEALDRTGGNIARAAHELGMCRRTLYRLIWRAKLWNVVDAVRRKKLKMDKVEPDWLVRTRRALR